MKREKLLFIIPILFMGLFFTSPAGAIMIKEVAMGLFLDAPTLEEGTYFYLRSHGPEVARCSGPWMTRYQSWLPYEPPKEAVELFGAVRGRYAELWFHEQDYLERGPLKGASQPPWVVEGRQVGQNRQINVMIPCLPTEEFYDSNPHPEKTTILRWVTVIAYPEGVSLEEGERWFLDVYAKEALKQPGLLEFVSHRVWEDPTMKVGGDAVPAGMKEIPSDIKDMPRMPSWVRLCEYWYKDFEAWRKAVLESPPKYTAPPWGGKYPFVEMVSTFLPYSPDIDFLKGTYTPGANVPLKR